MGPAGLIAVKDLRLRFRDRSALITGIVAPLALALIFDLVFGSALGTQTIDLEIGVVDQDQSSLSRTFTGALGELEDEGLLVYRAVEDREQADRGVEQGELAAYILIEEGLEESAFTASSYTIRVVGDVDRPTSTQIAASIAESFAESVGRAQLSVMTAFALTESPPPAESGDWAGRAGSQSAPFRLADLSADTRQLDASTFFAAGMAVFFLFFTVQFGVLGILEEEREGTMARLLAAPVGRSAVVSGKAILSFALGVVSMAVLVVSTSLLMGADWGPPLGVALLVASGVAAGVGILGLVAAVARSPEGAGNLGSIIAVALGMLGGTFFPIGQGDDLLSRLTFVAPHAWFMRGLADISGGAGWSAALPSVAAMLTFATGFGAAGWVLLQRRMAR